MIRIVTGLLVLACSLIAGAASVPTEGIVLRTNVVLVADDILIWTGSYWTNVARSSLGGGSGSVESVGATSTVSGLSFTGGPVTTTGVLSLGGTVGIASGGTGATNAAAARAALGLEIGVNAQAYDADLADLADGSLTGSKVGSGIDDDNVAFDDADGIWTATTVGAALEELNDSINAGVPNGTGAKVHWSELLGVPAGFADGTDDGAGGGSGTVTSIGLTLPTSIFDVASSPVTTSGTIAVTLDTQTANLIFAGPASGGAATPTFRSMVDADIPSAITRDSEVAAAYQPLDADLTALAAGTAVATLITNSASIGAPVLMVGTTNVAAALAAAGVSGGGGNVYTSSNNIFTASNSFPYLDIGTLTVTTNLLIADEAYASGWNGSSNVPTKNAIYDKIESLAVGGTALLFNGVIGVSNQVDSDQIVFVKTNGTAAGRLASNLVVTSISAPSLVVTGSVSLAAPTLTGVVTSTNLAATYAALAGAAMTGALSNTVSVGSPTLYVGTTNVASALAGKEALNSNKYQATNATLTALVGGTAIGTAITNSVSVGAPTLYVGTTNVAAALASAGGSSSSSAWTSISTDFLGQDSYGWAESQLPWIGLALDGGTAARENGEVNRPGIVSLKSSTSANSGWFFKAGQTEGILLTSNMFSECVFKLWSTNKVVFSTGFSDALSAAAPTDGLEVVVGRDGTPATWNKFEGRAISNGSATTTATGYFISPNVWYRATIETSADASSATFVLWDATSNTFPGTGLWTNTVASNIPTGAGRVTGHGAMAYTTNAAAADYLVALDTLQMSSSNQRCITRR